MCAFIFGILSCFVINDTSLMAFLLHLFDHFSFLFVDFFSAVYWGSFIGLHFLLVLDSSCLIKPGPEILGLPNPSCQFFADMKKRTCAI
jgi:hypothetical protein